MFTILISVVAFLFMVGILVTFHEYGHFWVARRCGVKVLKFSIGFGRPLCRWTDKYKTEFVLGWLPLGGYVKMLDEREGPVPDNEKQYAFNRASVWRRILIVFAGPAFNFMLAIFFYWLVFMIGLKVAMPIVGDIEPGSPADRAGLIAGQEIVSIDDRPSPSWQSAIVGFLDHLGEEEPIHLQVRNPGESALIHTSLTMDQWPEEIDPALLLRALGFDMFRPEVPALIGQVMLGGAASDAGLLVGDKVTELNGKAVNWSALVNSVQENPGKEIMLTVERKGNTLQLPMTVGTKENEEGKIGWLGVGVDHSQYGEEYTRTLHHGPVDSLVKAVDKTLYYSGLTLEMIGKMISGQASLDNLSGPVTIAQGAGQTIQTGWVYYLSFLAVVSISLGVLNLLPIPLLDGGHLLFYAFEAIRGRALSEQTQEWGMRLGAAMLVTLFSVAFYNDILRLM